MSLTVDAIQFNHDPATATNNALNIRVNATTPVIPPEWRRGISVNASDSPAAYAISAVGGNTITIKARFSSLPAALPGVAVKVRAVTAPVKFHPPFFPFVPFNPLGDVVERTFILNAAGQSGWIEFNVTGHLGSTIRATNITWNWQLFNPHTNQWDTFATTKHRIYVLLAISTAPWQQTSALGTSNTQLPWTAVLDFACQWAFGAANADAAAGLITDHVYALGPGTITYDCPGFGSSHYAGGTFNCTKFLDRLHGGQGNGQYVNCTDCATITSTFANILGCDLSQSKMGNNFLLKPLLAIGSSTWQTACGWTQFSYHEVAWKPPCGVNDNIFDACLEVNTNASPPPFAGVLPKNMPFNVYRPLLSSGGNCNPLSQCTRRAVV